MRRTTGTGLALAMALALSLVACTGAGAGVTIGPAGDPEPSTSAAAETAITGVPAAAPAAAQTPAVAEAAAAPPDIFTGTDRCQTRSSEPGSDPDSWPFVCERRTNDPRMTGQLVGSIASVDDVPALFAADHMVIGSSTLANAGGSWECREVWASSVTAKVTPRDQICLGHGGYIGLTAYVHTLAGEDVWTMGVIGSIEKTP